MFKSIIILFLISIITCKAQSNLHEIKKSDYTTITHTVADSVFVNSEPEDLSYSEILDIEKLLKQELGRKLKKHNYFRQYIAVKNQYNEKIVWVNFLCKKYYLPIMETQVSNLKSGDCFFELKVNLTKQNIFDFKQN